MQHGYGRPIRVGDPGGLHPVPARRQVNANRCSLGAPAWGVVADLVCRVDHHQPTGRDLPFQCRLPLCDRQGSVRPWRAPVQEPVLAVAVRIGPLSDSSLVVRRVGSVRWVLVASPGYLAARGSPASPSELAEHDL